MSEERKLATILFADLAGSTALADEQDPERTRVRLERFYDAMAEEIQAAGDSERSAELEARAAEVEEEAHRGANATPRARLAIARGELGMIEEVLADESWLRRQTWFALPAAAARLDALAVVGTPADIERAFAPPRSYIEPFGLRALGVATGDETLLGRAAEGFQALGLDWHAAQTEHLRSLRKLALG